MSNSSKSTEQRAKLLPMVCRAFSEFGYRRTTTAKLAEECGVRENILYRIWPDKKAMFIAAIDDVFTRRAETWQTILADDSGSDDVVERIITFEAKHQGEFGFYRIVFTALAELDDPEIRAALHRMYHEFHKLVREALRSGKARSSDSPDQLSDGDAAWGLLGLATISNIVRELKLVRPRQRESMFASVATALAGSPG